ncbi:MAG: hypothetical protein M0R75_06975 [Dehalococcoidia bacterium]|nr:hypothetical protein [Dehalococcoidia bacterium]
MEKADLDYRFGFHPAAPDTGPKHDRIRAAAREFAEVINEVAPDSRQKSLAVTALEESMHWANAAIACNEAPAAG